MAEVKHQTTDVTDPKGNSTGNFIVKWPAMKNGDIGQPWQAAQWADRNTQVVGTFGAGGSLTMEGSNIRDPATTDFQSLHDSQGLPIAITAAGFVEISEVPWYTRPKVTNGDVTTSLDVIMMVRRTNSK